MQYLQTATACLVLIMAGNLGQALVRHAPQNTAQNAPQNMTNQPIRIAAASYSQPAVIVLEHTPVLLLADPGMAYVMSAPSRQLQVRVEGSNTGHCQNHLLQTDAAGVLSLPVAATRSCQQPRLVVLH